MQCKWISDTVFFWHRYITQPTITPDDQNIKEVGDLASALHWHKNLQGNKGMAVLQKMNSILNNSSVEKHTRSLDKNKETKQVTFRDPIPEPRVDRNTVPLQLPPTIVTLPRVVLDKPTITNTVINKPLHRSSLSGITMWSQYAGLLAHITCRSMQCQPICYIM